MNRVMTSLVPDIDSLKQSSNGVYHIQHSYVVHNDKKKRIHFFYFQNEEKAPPRHPSIDESWDKIIGHQSSILQSLKQQETRHRQHKKQQVSETIDDDELLEMHSKFTAEAIKHNIPALDYWKNWDAIKLFNPLPGEPVQETLHQHNKILLDFVNPPE
jgi:hypothetical protein